MRRPRVSPCALHLSVIRRRSVRDIAVGQSRLLVCLGETDLSLLPGALRDEAAPTIVKQDQRRMLPGCDLLGTSTRGPVVHKIYDAATVAARVGAFQVQPCKRTIPYLN